MIDRSKLTYVIHVGIPTQRIKVSKEDYLKICEVKYRED